MELPIRTNLNHERELRDNLLRLIQQVQFRYPKFSAAGCFDIDISLISRIFMTVVIHVVLLMQFN